MSEPKLISPMLDNFAMGDPFSDHDGIVCCPAMERDSDNRYIVKVISIPASPSRLDALLLSGAYPNTEAAMAYFADVADGVVKEVETLSTLSDLEGFLPYEKYQLVPKEDGTGFDIYLLSTYKRSLRRNLRNGPLTHLAAVNLGLDICAALSVCRRSGYLYVDLKPDNIFVSDDGAYRIGDLGFIAMDSLKFAALPDKYRSAYTAPEIEDAFSALNDKLDIYAAGLILYQVYNNGVLPFEGNKAPNTVLQPPMNADYEMSEIILKACAPDPNDRWSDPVEMGQALISYMQRNGANDTPIIPPATPVAEPEQSAEEEHENTADDTYIPETAEPSEPAESEAEDAAAEPDAEAASVAVAELPPEEVPSEIEPDDELTEEELAQISYSDITEDVSEMLDKIDDLAAHTVPDPVIAPEPITVSVPEPDAAPEAETESVEIDMDDQEPLVNEAQITAELSEITTDDSETPDDEQDEEPFVPHKRPHIIRNTLIALLVLLLIGGGVYFYRDYYIQSIDSLQLNGYQDILNVTVETAIDNTQLFVICSDTYGNKISEPVVEGTASFKNLTPNTTYSVSVIMEGLHKLTGQTTATYSTPSVTNFVQLTAVTGPENGSVKFSFTFDGPDSDEWVLTYSTPGEGERSVTFTGHMVTVTGLTVGSTYQLQVSPKDALFTTGKDTTEFTACELVYAKNLQFISLVDGVLSVKWDEPENASVSTWTVVCDNGEGNTQSITTEGLSASFEGIDNTQSISVAVIAVGQSECATIAAPANFIAVSDFKANTASATQIGLSWNISQEMPEDGLRVVYSIGDYRQFDPITVTENSATITSVVPGAKYAISIQKADGSVLLGSPFYVETSPAKAFESYYGGNKFSTENMKIRMCKTPDRTNWNYRNVSEADYTTAFSPDESASLVVNATLRYGTSKDVVRTLFVITDSEGNIKSVDYQDRTWNDMWKNSYCYLTVPNMPSVSGDYTLDIYFNGQSVFTQDFTIQ